MEFVIEFLMEIYLEIAMSFMPDKKLNKWLEVLLSIICGVVSLVIFFSLLAGISILVAEPNKLGLGITLTSIGAFLLIVQISLWVVAILRKKQMIQATDDNVDTETSEEKL